MPSDDYKALQTDNWIPWAYFETWRFGPRTQATFAYASPLDPRILVKSDGTRYVRYQTPKSPVKPSSLKVGGYLRSTADGQLLNPANKQAGSVDYTTGLFEVWIDYDESPGAGSREIAFEVES